MSGLSAAKSVEVEYLTERGSVSPQNVHILMPSTINVMEMTMKRRNVMKNVAQVCYTTNNFVNSYLSLSTL